MRAGFTLSKALPATVCRIVMDGLRPGAERQNRVCWHDPDNFHYEVFCIISQHEILAAKLHWAASRSLRTAERWKRWL